MLEYFLITAAVTLLTHAYFALRLLGSSRASRRRRVGRALLAANFLLLPAATVLALSAPARAAAWVVPLAHLAFFDVGFCILLFAATLLRDALWAPAWLAARAWGLLRPRPVDTARRELLRRGLDVAVVGAAGAASVAGYGVALRQPVVRRVRVPFAASRVPAGWRGLRVAHVSDLHVGPTIRRGYVEALVARVNALGADVVVITGDLVDGTVAQLGAQVEPLRALRAPHGVYFVTGNHEYFYRAPEWRAALRALGVKVLSDAHDVIEHDGARVMIAGVDDPAGARDPEARGAAMARALRDGPACALRLLLAHRPSDAAHAASWGFDAQLSGHLHGGQFFPLTLALRAAEPHVAGLYRERGMWLYVNRGAGYWGPPNRLGARQEIALLELVAA